MMEKWNTGIVEGWNNGILESWKNGHMKRRGPRASRIADTWINVESYGLRVKGRRLKVQGSRRNAK
jgi:hypothetical protein